MNVAQFDNLLQMVYNLIKKEDTQIRMAIPPKTKLEVTLRCLDTGIYSFKSLEYIFLITNIYILLIIIYYATSGCDMLNRARASEFNRTM